MDMGLECKTIRYAIVLAHPRLSGYVQEAYNLMHSAAQIEPCFQVLRKVHVEAARYQLRSSTPPWDAIKRKSEPRAPLTPRISMATRHS